MAAKEGYHHGNLRRALMDEALRVVRAKGVGALSLREVACAVGVSHAAPYHHFADKTALLHALAHEGMRLMDERMARAEAAAGDDEGARLLAIGMSYVAFAVERPDYYAAISAPELADEVGQPLEEWGEMWRRLMQAVVDCQRVGRLPAGDPVVLALSLWSLVHGLAELWQHGPLRLMPQAKVGLEALARQVLGSALGSMELAAKGEVA